MNEQVINCPKCGEKIPISEVLTHNIREALRKEHESEVQQRQQEYERIIKAKEQEYDDRLTAERAHLLQKARQQAADSVALELTDLKNQVDERSRKLESARQQELELRQRQRDLEDREKNNALELARRVDEERLKIWQEVTAKADGENQIKLREKELQLDQMRRQIEELQRKAEQGPQPRQGEALELELEESLQAKFPLDEIAPVPKGKHGADIIQRVRGINGQTVGAITWEAKRTRSWSDGWLQKLKDDQREIKADMGVIVTDVLPGDSRGIIQLEGIWITDFRSALGLALVLREALLQVASARNALTGKNEKMEFLYSYLAGPEFKQRIEAIVESFATMKTDLDAERRAMEKHWSKREKQIERVIKNTAGLHGDLAGIVGTSLPAVQILELTAATKEE